MPRLDLRVCAAKNLPNLETFGKIDPYCTVSFEGKQWRTKVIDNTCNPEWDEVFKFNVADADSSRIHFVLWDNNMVSDDFLGEYYMSISGLDRGKVEDKWVLLQNCKANAELHIRLLAVDFGDIEPAEREQETAPHPEPPRQMPAGYQPPPQYFAQAPPFYGQGPPQQQQQQPQPQSLGGFGGVPPLSPYLWVGSTHMLRSRNGTVASALPNGGDCEMSLILSTWQQFLPEVGPTASTVTFKTFHNTYLRSNPAAESAIDSVPTKEAATVFEVEPNATGYTFRSVHQSVMQAPPGDNQPLRSVFVAQPSTWERFYIEPLPIIGMPPIASWNGKQCRIRSYYGTVLSALPNDGILQTTHNMDSWETYVIEIATDSFATAGQFRLKTYHNTYVRCNPGPDAAVDSVSSSTGTWELWQAEPNYSVEGHGILLHSYHGTNMHIDAGENMPVKAIQQPPNEVGPSERLYIQLLENFA